MTGVQTCALPISHTGFYQINGYLCYEGAGLFGLGYNCGWQVLASVTLSPGQWAGWTGNTNTDYTQFDGAVNAPYQAGALTGLHTNATVDLVLQYGYWGTEPSSGGGCDGDGCTWAL